MKKTLIAVAGACLAACLAGCGQDGTACGQGLGKSGWTPIAFALDAKVVEIEGHRYVVLYGPRTGGIVHAASCPCGAK